MALGLSTTNRNSRADTIRDDVDAGGAGAELHIYDGVRPATGAAPAGSILATFVLPNPVAPNAAAGVSTWNSIAPVNIGTSGTATWFRVEDQANAQVIDGSVGLAASGADMELDSVTFVAGRLISIDTFVLTEGNA